MVWVALRGVQELAANQTHQEEAVHGQSHHLAVQMTGRAQTLLISFVLLCLVLIDGFQNECSL